MASQTPPGTSGDPSAEPIPAVYDADDLVLFAARLLAMSGAPDEMARDVAQVLVEGDLLGHDTHGLQLLPGYLNEISKGLMRVDGEPLVIAERDTVATWDGLRLPGPWLVRRAIAWARPRAQMHGSATVVIRRSHHIACLAAYLEDVARDGLVMLLMCSDPAVASVAPFGGTQAVFTPNPMAFGIPTSGEPILIDISASVTTNGMSNRMTGKGQRGQHQWWLDGLGQPTDDPAVLSQQPPGTILPLGGLDTGHKGYGLALLVEALTGGLAGHGRADVAEGWGATVYLQLYDPEAFSGIGALATQTDWIANACRDNAPRAADQPVRLPGERGLARKRHQQSAGVSLHPAILPALLPWSEKLHIALPKPL